MISTSSKISILITIAGISNQQRLLEACVQWFAIECVGTIDNNLGCHRQCVKYSIKSVYYKQAMLIGEDEGVF